MNRRFRKCFTRSVIAGGGRCSDRSSRPGFDSGSDDTVKLPECIWELRSQPVRTDGCVSRAAKWHWTSNNHEPRIIHGAVALSHPQIGSCISCRVEVNAYKFTYWLKGFRNDGDLRYWQVQPQPPDETLNITRLKDNLETEMKALNARLPSGMSVLRLWEIYKLTWLQLIEYRVSQLKTLYSAHKLVKHPSPTTPMPH